MSGTPIEPGPNVSDQERKTKKLLLTHEENVQKVLHDVQAGDEKLKVLLDAVRPADLAEMLGRLDDKDQVRAMQLLDLRRGALVLKRSRTAVAAFLMERLPTDRAADLLDALTVDDRARILDGMPPARREQILPEMEKKQADEVRQALSWPRHSAGRLLQTHVVKVPPDMTVAQTLARIREVNTHVEKVNDVYIVDEKGVLIGIASLRDLVCADAENTLSKIMVTDVITAKPLDDQELVARMISKYDFLSIPVVDEKGVFLGICTVDDIVDVLRHEATEDQLNQGGIDGHAIADLPYLRVPIRTIVHTRIWWLLMLFVAETLTGTVLRHFEDELAKVVALSFFIPLLIGTGGNAGSQTVSQIIRALALGEIEPKDAFAVFKREATAGLVLGILLGVVAFGRALLWGTSMPVSIAVAVSILVICVWANTVGSLVPLTAVRLGFDPTVMSAPLITTLVDATGLFIYFRIAGLILGL